MRPFTYERATTPAAAAAAGARNPGAKFIAGGTNLLDLMKEDVERPTRLIDITQLPLTKIEETAAGGLRIGALVPNSDLAWHAATTQRYPVLASAICKVARGAAPMTPRVSLRRTFLLVATAVVSHPPRGFSRSIRTSTLLPPTFAR